MTPDKQCKQAGLKGFWELIVLSDQPVSTLKNWNRTQNKGCTKFQLAIDAALYRREKK